MTRRSEEPTIRVHVVMFKKDWEFLKTYYGGEVKISYNVRKILRFFINRIKERANVGDSSPAVELDLSQSTE